MNGLKHKILVGIAALVIPFSQTDKVNADSFFDRLGNAGRQKEQIEHLLGYSTAGLINAFTIYHAVGDDPKDPRKAERLAAESTLSLAASQEVFYSGILRQRSDPDYAMMDLAGIAAMYYSYRHLGFMKPFAKKLADVTEKENLLMEVFLFLNIKQRNLV